MHHLHCVTSVGSIPACAGEPECGETLCQTCRSIPACAGEPVGNHPVNGRRGLSPRVRGNHWRCTSLSGGVGSIPACAGEPSLAFSAGVNLEVYPRVCGGTPAPTHIPECEPEVYPRVCGGTGSKGSRLKSLWVYPRVCGGTRIAIMGGPLTGGSIPACAGEPTSRAPAFGRVTGLSPRVRGNQSSRRAGPEHQGSIPACAGEPRRGAAFISGAARPGSIPACAGEPWRHMGADGPCGSIPACAGEPRRIHQPVMRRRSIPACAGEPCTRWRAAYAQPGLSPRVRGNR